MVTTSCQPKYVVDPSLDMSSLKGTYKGDIEGWDVKVTFSKEANRGIKARGKAKRFGNVISLDDDNISQQSSNVPIAGGYRITFRAIQKLYDPGTPDVKVIFYDHCRNGRWIEVDNRRILKRK